MYIYIYNSFAIHIYIMYRGIYKTCVVRVCGQRRRGAPNCSQLLLKAV